MNLSRKQQILLLCTLIGIVFFVSSDTPSSRVEAQDDVIVPEQFLEIIQPTVEHEGTYEYLEITDSCDPYFEGHCIPAYAGPGTQFEEVSDLRKDMIFKIRGRVQVNGQLWYRVYFDEWLRHPERVNGDWYIPAVAGRVIRDDGEKILGKENVITSKKIIIDPSEHMIYAYDGNTLFFQTKVASGIESTPTPVGTFSIYKKTPTRYMQGPIPGVSDVPFDLPGVPWNMYFTDDGAVIHGSYWHDRYGTNQSSGCINLPSEIAKILYDWAPLGTTVTVRR